MGLSFPRTEPLAQTLLLTNPPRLSGCSFWPGKMRLFPRRPWYTQEPSGAGATSAHVEVISTSLSPTSGYLRFFSPLYPTRLSPSTQEPRKAFGHRPSSVPIQDGRSKGGETGEPQNHKATCMGNEVRAVWCRVWGMGVRDRQ